MTTFAVIAGSAGAGAFAVLVALLWVTPRGNRVGRLLIVASCVSAAWFATTALYYHGGDSPRFSFLGVQLLELARDALWLLFLARLLEAVGDRYYRRRVHLVTGGLLAMLAAAALLVALPREAGAVLDADPTQVRKLLLLVILMVVLGGLLLTEQLFRNTARDSRWALKHLCFGLGLVFAYDFYLYADAVLFNRIDPMIWTSRGLVNAIAVPMIALSVSRNRKWELNIFVSRRVVFHGVTLVAAGVYLMAMAAAGYYIQVFGGEWGRALKTAFFSAALLVLLTLFFSAQVRSRVRMFLARHFYRNKYEYGEEWLKFTQALSRASLEPESLHHTILESVADIVDSPGGIILQKTAAGSFEVAANLSVYGSVSEVVPGDAPFVRQLQVDGVAWDLNDDTRADSEALVLVPGWLRDLPRVGLVVPVVHRDELLAILVLARPRSNQPLDFEDLDLLSTVGRQAAGYLALMRANDALSEARQFETFNRLSAFLVHDLKNVVAQLSLIVRNAERHGDNPEFVADAFNTVGDAVAKMNRMLASLRQMQTEVESDEVVDVATLARQAVAAKQDQAPAPVLRGEIPAVRVRASRDRLLAVIEHLLQNAVEATDADGTVEVAVEQVADEVRVVVADTGCGMDREFIRNRLFKAFDTTKGKAGMGIGAYESRHVISSMGGELLVDSEPGRGSRFTIVLPACDGGAPELLKTAT